MVQRILKRIVQRIDRYMKRIRARLLSGLSPDNLRVGETLLSRRARQECLAYPKMTG